MTIIGSGLEVSDGPRIIKATNLLQNKIGTGEISSEVLLKLDNYFESVTIDFMEIAAPHLSKIEAILKSLPESDYGRESYIEDIIKPVMELKSTSGTFNERVIAQISGLVLGFLESVLKLNDDVLDIICIHNVSIAMVLRQDIKSVDDPEAKKILLEIKEACLRYHKKYNLRKE